MCSEAGKKGKEVLQDFVQNAKLNVEYVALTEEEKGGAHCRAGTGKGNEGEGLSAISEIPCQQHYQDNGHFGKWGESQLFCILPTDKIQINNLQSRSGIEAMLFVTHGSMDTPLNGTAFTMPSIKDFLLSVLELDKLEFLAWMDGYAIQGLKGTCSVFLPLLVCNLI